MSDRRASDSRGRVSPSIDRRSMDRFRRHGWSHHRVRSALGLLDDTGLRMLAVFGDPRLAARVGNDWVILIAGMTVRAEAIRSLYEAVGSSIHGGGRASAGVIADSLMLAASDGPLTVARVEAMAPKLAPAVGELFVSEASAIDALLAELINLEGRRLLERRAGPSGSTIWQLTGAGLQVVRHEIRPRWLSVAE